MIRFRCWYCNKKYAVAEDRVGQRITCTCQRPLRIPKRNGDPCRVKTLTDWLIEAVVYGGGGALLGLGLSLLILSKADVGGAGFWLVPGCVLMGFLFGTFGGEVGVNFLGGLIRDRESE
jgi:hypothetical protein